MTWVYAPRSREEFDADLARVMVANEVLGIASERRVAATWSVCLWLCDGEKGRKASVAKRRNPEDSQREVALEAK